MAPLQAVCMDTGHDTGGSIEMQHVTPAPPTIPTVSVAGTLFPAPALLTAPHAAPSSSSTSGSREFSPAILKV